MNAACAAVGATSPPRVVQNAPPKQHAARNSCIFSAPELPKCAAANAAATIAVETYRFATRRSTAGNANPRKTSSSRPGARAREVTARHAGGRTPSEGSSSDVSAVLICASDAIDDWAASTAGSPPRATASASAREDGGERAEAYADARGGDARGRERGVEVDASASAASAAASSERSSASPSRQSRVGSYLRLAHGAWRSTPPGAAPSSARSIASVARVFAVSPARRPRASSAGGSAPGGWTPRARARTRARRRTRRRTR